MGMGIRRFPLFLAFGMAMGAIAIAMVPSRWRLDVLCVCWKYKINPVVWDWSTLTVNRYQYHCSCW